MVRWFEVKKLLRKTLNEWSNIWNISFFGFSLGMPFPRNECNAFWTILMNESQPSHPKTGPDESLWMGACETNHFCAIHNHSVWRCDSGAGIFVLRFIVDRPTDQPFLETTNWINHIAGIWTLNKFCKKRKRKMKQKLSERENKRNYFNLCNRLCQLRCNPLRIEVIFRTDNCINIFVC